MPVRICWSEKDCSSLRDIGADVDFRRPSRMMVAERRIERMFVIMKDNRVCECVLVLVGWGVDCEREEWKCAYACTRNSSICIGCIWDLRAVQRHRCFGFCVFPFSCCFLTSTFTSRIQEKQVVVWNDRIAVAVLFTNIVSKNRRALIDIPQITMRRRQKPPTKRRECRKSVR